MTRMTLYGVFLIGTLVFSSVIGLFALQQSLEELERRGQADLALSSDRLVSRLQAYRELAVVLAQDPRLNANLSPNETGTLLRRVGDVIAAVDIVLLDRDGGLIGSAATPPPRDWQDEPFVIRAQDGASGIYHRLSDRFDLRAFYIGVPIFAPNGPVDRLLVVVLDVEQIESESRGTVPVIMFSDDLGVVFVSNRSELLLMQRGTGTRSSFTNYNAADLRPFFDHRARTIAGFDIWITQAGRYVPKHALYLAQDIPLIGMQAEALIDIRPALFTAGMQALAAGALCLFFCGVLAILIERRRALAEANAVLEANVSERTVALRQTNETLRAEITERQEAEAALRRAQAELVQAGKLSALGQMSAGISHELNQPLMAIQSFAQNGTAFLDRDDIPKARANLQRISDLAGRMGRIIKNFKAFARQEMEPAGRVDLLDVVRAAVEVSEPRLTQDAVTLHRHLPPHPVWVMGGEVRLQQVLVNLITNAIDAMVGQDQKAITLRIETGTAVTLTVQDTGPGIENPKQIFDPYYTTKSAGGAEGTGLGLSISYGLVQSFGGKIKGQNIDAGGALFTVELQPWAEEDAA